MNAKNKILKFKKEISSESHKITLLPTNDAIDEGPARLHAKVDGGQR
jgi:hypothetical protein